FQNNIRLACERVIADKRRIERFFQDAYSDLTLRSLDRIESTGSDFHKGGKQVLTLEFSAIYIGRHIPPSRHQLQPGPRVTTFKLMYKPSDVEIDCLIAGKSDAINAVMKPRVFMTESLTEIFNALCVQQQANLPNALPLPTYRILPIKYM